MSQDDTKFLYKCQEKDNATLNFSFAPTRTCESKHYRQIRTGGSGLKSRRGICPVTGERNNWSSTDDDGLFCVYGDHQPLYGWTYRGLSRSGGSLYVREDGQDCAYLPPKQTYTKTQPSKETIKPKPVEERTLAPIEIRDRVYRALLDLCPLNYEHKEKLKRRNIRNLFELLRMGSMPVGNRRRNYVVKQVREKTKLSKEEIACVPGFHIDEKGWLQLKGPQGVLLPHLDLKGRIRGFQIRDMGENPPKEKYKWLSSGKGGPRGGSPVGFLQGNPNHKTLEICEGAFKSSSLLQVLDTRGVLHVAGVHSTLEIPNLIEEIGDIETVRVWFDADWVTNSTVRNALAKLIEMIQCLNLNIEVKGWPYSPKTKGIDDFLESGGRIEDVINLDIEGILRCARFTKSTAYLRRTFETNKGRQQAPLLPDAQALFEPEYNPTLEEKRAATEQATIALLREPVGTLCAHDGPTGSGKTRTFARHAPSHSTYAARNYKALFDAARAFEEEDRKYLFLFGRSAPPESADPETREQEETRWKQAGCKHYQQAATLGARGFSPCLGCPLFDEDRAKNCAYWAQREQALEDKGENIIIACASTLTNNKEFAEILGDQPNLDQSAGRNTLILDDIEDPLALVLRVVVITPEDAAQWVEVIPSYSSNLTKHLWYQAYRTLASATLRTLQDPTYPLKALRDAGIDASRADIPTDDKGRPLFILTPSMKGSREIPPLNEIESLACALAAGAEIKIATDAEGKRTLTFCTTTDLCDKLPETRAIFLDGTPDTKMLSWLADSLGMGFQASKLPQPTLNIIQIGDKLGSTEQAEHPEAVALRGFVRSSGGLVITKKARAQEGDAYFGRDERGLNAYSGAPITLLDGHHAMSADQAQAMAWKWKVFAKLKKSRLPFPTEHLPEKVEYAFGDPYRPWSRLQHTAKDPLAEHLKRHHYASTVLQAAARDRSPSNPKYLLSGEPLELNGSKVKVRIMTTKELRDFLVGQGVEVAEPPPREIPEQLATLNKERSFKKKEAILEDVERVKKALGEGATLEEVRKFLGGGDRNKVRGARAREVWGMLNRNSEQDQEVNSLSKGGTDTNLYNTKVCVCPTPSNDNKSLILKEVSVQPHLESHLGADPNPEDGKDCVGPQDDLVERVQYSRIETIPEPLYRKKNYSLLTDKEIEFWDNLLDEIPPKTPVAPVAKTTQQETVVLEEEEVSLASPPSSPSLRDYIEEIMGPQRSSWPVPDDVEAY